MSIADKLSTIAENVPKVYEAGRQKEYDEFWDNFQQNGDRTHYAYSFSGRGWNDNNFFPKYDIIPTESFARGFAYSQMTGSLSERLAQCGVRLDTSNLDYTEYVFDNCNLLTEIPLLVGKYSLSGVFMAAGSLETASIQLEERTTLYQTFYKTFNLKNLTVIGTIGYNGTDLSACTKLSKESIESVINALSTSASGKTITLSKVAVNTAFETSAGAGDGEASTRWISLEQSRQNWTISLV